jgi:hypothetical protein
VGNIIGVEALFECGGRRRAVLLGMTTAIATASLAPCTKAQSQSTDPLAYRNGGSAKQAIMDFVRVTTNQVSPEDRIATFHQDGTLWVEHPVYTQAVSAIERLHTLAPKHPEWTEHEPYMSVLNNDTAAMAKLSERDWAEIVFVIHGNPCWHESG